MDTEFKLNFNNLSYFVSCINRYIIRNKLNAEGWSVISVGTGTAHDTWHYTVTIQSPSGMEKTIRIPMYADKKNYFEKYYLEEV